MEAPRCIYSGLEIPPRGFSLDHFLPHDRLWNLVPTLHEVNSKKGDRLPEFSYLAPLADIQARAYQSALMRGELKLLEDYFDIWPELTPSQVGHLERAQLEAGLRRVLTPLHQIACNSGFPAGWHYAC